MDLLGGVKDEIDPATIRLNSAEPPCGRPGYLQFYQPKHKVAVRIDFLPRNPPAAVNATASSSELPPPPSTPSRADPQSSSSPKTLDQLDISLSSEGRKQLKQLATFRDQKRQDKGWPRDQFRAHMDKVRTTLKDLKVPYYTSQMLNNVFYHRLRGGTTESVMADVLHQAEHVSKEAAEQVLLRSGVPLPVPFGENKPSSS